MDTAAWKGVSEGWQKINLISYGNLVNTKITGLNFQKGMGE